MNIVSIEWRLDGCGPDCMPRRHDPLCHENHGRLLERKALQRWVVVSGPLAVDIDAHRVTVDGDEKRLTRTEREILLALARQAGRMVTVQDIVSEVWGPEYQTDAWHLVRVNMSRLRARLGSAAHLIVTVLNTGYRLDLAPISPLAPRPRQHPSRVLAQWALQWQQCQSCGTTDRPHYARGLCDRCYPRVRRQEASRP